MLVIANLGLEEPALCSEVCARGDRAGTEAMIIAPVTSSRLQTLTDDNGAQMRVAQGRVAIALETLKREGISVGGHAAAGEPMGSLLDGLRQFDANEVVMLSGGETGWEADQARAFTSRQVSRRPLWRSITFKRIARRPSATPSTGTSWKIGLSSWARWRWSLGILALRW